MNASFVLWLILSVAILVFLIAYFLNLLVVNVLNPDGKGCDKKSRRAISRFALPRRFKVLSDIELEHKGRTTRIENLLIGHFGILLVTTCGARGEYYGEIDSDEWILIQDKKKTSFPNPVTKQERDVGIIRNILSQNKLYNVPVEHIVFIPNRSKKTLLFITHGGEILFKSSLGAYLDKTKFESDIGLDIEKIFAVLSGNSSK